MTQNWERSSRVKNSKRVGEGWREKAPSFCATPFFFFHDTVFPLCCPHYLKAWNEQRISVWTHVEMLAELVLVRVHTGWFISLLSPPRFTALIRAFIGQLLSLLSTDLLDPRTWNCCFLSLIRLTFKLQDQRQFEGNNVIVLVIERKRIRHFSFTFVFKILSPNLPPSRTVADHISPSLASGLVWAVNLPHLLQILTFIMPSLTSEEIAFFVNGKKVGNLSNLPASICVCLIPRSSK